MASSKTFGGVFVVLFPFFGLKKTVGLTSVLVNGSMFSPSIVLGQLEARLADHSWRSVDDDTLAASLDTPQAAKKLLNSSSSN